MPDNVVILQLIGIEIKIEGERELNAQINRITKQYEMLSLEVERVKKAYDGERNTAAALNSQLMATQEVIKSLKDQWSAYAQKSEAVSKASVPANTESFNCPIASINCFLFIPKIPPSLNKT